MKIQTVKNKNNFAAAAKRAAAKKRVPLILRYAPTNSRQVGLRQIGLSPNRSAPPFDHLLIVKKNSLIHLQEKKRALMVVVNNDTEESQ